MTARSLTFMTVVAAAICGAGSAAAQPMPADCSKAPIPDQPAVLRSPGQPDVALPAASLRVQSTMKMSRDTGEVTYDMQALTLTDSAGRATIEAQVVVLSRAGQKLDGRTFHRVPVKDLDAQEKSPTGDVLFQAWSIKGRNIDVNHVEFVASARVEFGASRGDQLPGKIRLCVAAGQKSMFGEVLKTSYDVVGTFSAAIRP